MDVRGYFDATPESYDAQYGLDNGDARYFYCELAVEAECPVRTVGCKRSQIVTEDDPWKT